MKCNECGAENRNDARFCADCGVELRKVETPKDTKACFNCDFENTRDAKFCASCGVELRRHHEHQSHHHHQQQKQLKRKEKRVNPRLKWHPALVGLLIIGGVTLLLTIPYITGNSPGRKPQPERIIEQRSSDPKIEAKVIEVASQFICSCGTCGEEPLDVCSCNTAVQERQFIRNAFQSGQTADQIVAAVNSTYGRMKPEFVVKYDSVGRRSVPEPVRSKTKSNRGQVPTGKTNTPAKQTAPLQAGTNTRTFSQLKIGNIGIATAFDREEVFSRFRCPCGQCGIDELKDCSCDHPRGAKEVKAFVDQKIAERKYTVAQLVDQLDERYGGKKF